MVYELVAGMLAGRNELHTSIGVSVDILGRRMSGDMNTSLGNGFTNWMLARFIIEEQQGKRLYGFVEGDDGLFVTDGVLTKEMYARLGFTIKIDTFDDPCVASFCGLVFSSAGEIIRDSVKFLMGAGWTSSFVHAGERVMDALLMAKCLSVLCETPNCPIVGAWAEEGIRRSHGVAPRWVDDGYHVHTSSVRAFAPTPEVRALFASRYNISVSAQLLIEAAIRADDFASVFRLVPFPPECSRWASRYVVVG